MNWDRRHAHESPVEAIVFHPKDIPNDQWHYAEYEAVEEPNRQRKKTEIGVLRDGKRHNLGHEACQCTEEKARASEACGTAVTSYRQESPPTRCGPRSVAESKPTCNSWFCWIQG